MQRARFFTDSEAEIAPDAGAEEGAPATLWARLPWIGLATGVLIVAAAAWLAAHPNPAAWDQARLLEARLEAGHAPAPPMGFSAQLLVVALRPFAADADTLHWLVRSASLALWVAAAMWLASAVLSRPASRAALLAVLFTSQYPFLWLSTELVVGALLCAAIAAWLQRAPAWLTGGLLALLALAKPDLVLVAGVLLAFFAWERRDEARVLAASAVAWAAVLLLPGVATGGLAYLTGYDGESHSFASFSQHLAALLAPLQLAPAPHPWREPQPYVQHLFADAGSVWQAATTPGLPYLDFVALSLAKGVRKAAWTFQWAWLAVPLLWWLRRRAQLGSGTTERVLWLSFIGLVPFVLFAYPHVRYLARYYPIFWLLLLVSLERVVARGAAERDRGVLLAAGVALLAAFAVNVQRASLGMALAPRLELYWFPD